MIFGVVADTPGMVLRTLLFRLQWVSNEEWFEKWAPLAQRNANGSKRVVFWCFNPQSTARRQAQTFLGFFSRDLFIRGNSFPKDNEMDMQLRAIL